MDAERLLLLLLLDGRQDACHSSREHGLSGSRAPDHEQAELACGRYRHTAFRDFLSHDIGKIGLRPGMLVARHAVRMPLDRFANADSKRPDVRKREVADGIERNVLLVDRGHERQAGRAGEQLIGDLPAHRAYRAVKRELSNEQQVVQSDFGNLVGRRENRHGDRKVEAGPALAHISRREIHRDALSGNLEARGTQRAPDASAGLENARVGHADKRDARHPFGHGDLDGHRVRLDAAYASRMHRVDTRAAHCWQSHSKADIRCSISARNPGRSVTAITSKRSAKTGKFSIW